MRFFDPENRIVQLCAAGMQFEGQGRMDLAAQQFKQAWQEATRNEEKFVAAHYIARHQPGPAEKLVWDQRVLHLAKEIDNEEVKAVYPSLYLNVGKGFEDLGDIVQALQYYRFAQEYLQHLPGDGYKEMIRSGIEKGIERVIQSL